MGVILPQTIEINANNRYNKFYLDKGYEIKNKKIIVKVQDLQEKSGQRINCICDHCNKHFTKARVKIKDINEKTFCSKCAIYSAEDTCMKKYGYKFAWSSPEVQKNIQKRNMEKYGVKCTFQLKKVREKSKQTLLDKYNVDNIAKLDKTIKKMKNTNKERYGCEFPTQNKEIKRKIYYTYIKNNGEDAEAKFIPCSKNQIKISKLLNGKLNKCIYGIYADICIGDIIIEYDGGGHELGIKLNKITREEFYKKERMREQKILDNNYKLIRIICKNDILPDNDIIINTINNIKNDFNNSNYKIARWNLNDNSIIYE